jgi:zinc D-Ala-D-Ala carboxypeptidase
MKKWGFLFFFALCLAFVAVNLAKAPFFQDIQEGPIIKVEVEDGGDSRKVGEEREIASDQVYQGNLLLVNSEYPVYQESVKSDIVNLYKHKERTKGYELLDTEVELSVAVAKEFSKMVNAAEKEGVHNFVMNSGFRGFDEQSILYEDMGPAYALPAGYSEHNLGLSLDVGSTEAKMEDAPEGKWIERNAWKYGFILRYPKDKTDVTGIQYEPWHIRYVGLPHSAIMQEKNFALEEYLDYLKEEKNVSVTVNNKHYTVSYYAFSEGMTITLPENNQYEISGDNMDGIIVTVNKE